MKKMPPFHSLLEFQPVLYYSIFDARVKSQSHDMLAQKRIYGIVTRFFEPQHRLHKKGREKP